VIPFDVVTMWEVIEHVHDPALVLQKCRRWMRPDGLLFLTCPNVDSLEIMLLGREAPMVTHDHLNCFTPDAVASLLERSGFTVLDMTTPGKLDVELVQRAIRDGSIHSRKLGVFLPHVLSDDRLASSFQRWLVRARLSSHLQVVARRD